MDWLIIKLKKEKNMSKEKTEELIEATFLDKNGKVINIKDVIDKEDCWKQKGGEKFIITYKALKHIANLAGISKNFEIEESDKIIPDYRNDLEYIVRATITCKAKSSKENPEECVHGERKMTATGEANRLNCPYRGRDYLRKMSEKRAHMIAILEHLDLYSSIYCEDEAEAFTIEKEPNLMPGMVAFENIVVEINALLNAKDDKELKKFGKKIKAGIKVKKYNDMQLKYLRELYQKELARRQPTF
jgi:hypothetical protein